MIGIYKIKNKVTGKSYIGSSKQIEKRWEQHLQTLKKGIHHSILLQRAWNKYEESSFQFEVLEECEEDVLLEREQRYLNMKPEYNVGLQASGGDNFSKHPNKREILKRRIQTQKNKLSKLTSKERKRIYGKNKELNSNWKGGKTFCKCGVRINSGAKSCIKCIDRTGSKNPFFNKKHSEKTKQILKEYAAMRTKKPSNTKKVIIEGIEYVSANEVAKVFNISRSLVNYRCKSKKYNWEFKNNKKK
jgi:group I intron endonuclease